MRPKENRAAKNKSHISLAPLSLEDALRGAMRVDPKKVKGKPPKKPKDK